MHRSKLDAYHAILRALAIEPLTVDQLSYKVATDCVVAKKRLGFLLSNGLVKELDVCSTTAYLVSERGNAVLKTLNFLSDYERTNRRTITMGKLMNATQSLQEHKQKKQQGINSNT